MRSKRLILVPVTALAALGLSAPATAVDFDIGVVDYDFVPRDQKVAVGDKVIWRFTDGGHTATSAPGQAESWDSDAKGAGETFERTFTKPGRFQYVCTPHESFPMKGVIVVGEDRVKDTVDAFKTKVTGTKVTVSFKLNEAAQATYKLTGASKRSVTRKRLKAGKQSITVKGLEAGGYSGTLTLSDDFDKKATQKKSFKIG
jgi:plastocyanin